MTVSDRMAGEGEVQEDDRSGTLDRALCRCCWILAAILAALVLIATLLWLGATRWPSRLTSVELGELRVEVASGRPRAIEVSARVRLTNRTPVPFNIYSIEFGVDLQGNEVARDRWQPASPVALPARGSAEFELQTGLDGSQLAAAALALLANPGVEPRLRARVEAGWALSRFTIPFEGRPGTSRVRRQAGSLK